MDYDKERKKKAACKAKETKQPLPTYLHVCVCACVSVCVCICGMYEAVYVNDIIVGVILFGVVSYVRTSDNMTHLYLYHEHRYRKPFIIHNRSV